MKNKLWITTTFLTFKEITSDFDLEVTVGEEFRLGVNVDYLNVTKTVKVYILII